MDKLSNGKLCAKCGEKPAAQNHAWCAQCKAESQKKYDADREGMLESRGFAKGCEAMRDTILTGLRNVHPAGLMRAVEVLNFVAATPTPEFDREKVLAVSLPPSG